MIHVYYGPEMEPNWEPINPLTQRSAAHCEGCKKRTVQTLVYQMPKMTPDMEESSLMAAAFCGPTVRWQCSCGERMYANYEMDW